MHRRIPTLHLVQNHTTARPSARQGNIPQARASLAGCVAPSAEEVSFVLPEKPGFPTQGNEMATPDGPSEEQRYPRKRPRFIVKTPESTWIGPVDSIGLPDGRGTMFLHMPDGHDLAQECRQEHGVNANDCEAPWIHVQMPHDHH